MSVPVVSFEMHWLGQPFATVARSHYARRLAQKGIHLPPFPPASPLADVEPLSVWVHHNRWVVTCPDCATRARFSHDSRHYQFAPSDPAIFFCLDCANALVGERWRPVVWPEQRADIEAILRARPMPEMRNWLPEESLAELIAENREHGHAERFVEVLS